MVQQLFRLKKTIGWPNPLVVNIPYKKIKQELNSCLENATVLRSLLEQEESKISFLIKKKKEYQFYSHINL